MIYCGKYSSETGEVLEEKIAIYLMNDMAVNFDCNEEKDLQILIKGLKDRAISGKIRNEIKPYPGFGGRWKIFPTSGRF